MSSSPHREAVIRAAGPLVGEFRVPGDKSISHRAALLGARAEGTTVIENFATNRDCFATLACLESLGTVARVEGTRVTIEGRGRSGFTSPAEPLDAMNSGTTMRLLAGLLAGLPVEAEVTGDESLRRRPMERVARPLRLMGAGVETQSGLPPIRVNGRHRLRAIDYEPDAPSAQVKSAVLLAGLSADGRTHIAESVRTRDHTERLLAAFGATVGRDATGAWCEGPARLASATIEVPGDFSSAVFLIGAALLVEGSDVCIRDVGLNPTRTRLLDLLGDLGAPIEIEPGGAERSEPVGTIRVRYAERLGGRNGRTLDLGGRDVAEIIDEVPMLAILATRVEGGVRFRGASELRRKESDRISALCDGLGRMGADVEEAPDGFFVRGPRRLEGARVLPYGDHRIAMAFACAALAARGETTIVDPGIAAVSFPEFFACLPVGSVRPDGC